jgi:hypothetical protein
MTHNSFPLKNLFFSILVSLLPILVYVVILVAPIPYSISRLFVSYSFLYFLVILTFYYLSFRVKGKFDWLPGACLTAFIFAMGLSYLWASGYSNDMIIGGMLPFKDGFYYYYGARILSDGQLLAANSFQSAWRPLYPGFISSLFLITRFNLQAVLALQLGFLGICTYASAYMLRRSLGGITAALYMTFLYFYIQPMQGFLYTELLGLTTGCLGLILLWNSAKTKKISNLIIGLVVLIVAVSVRAGTFFIFPMLALWAGWVFRMNKVFSFRVFVISLLTIMVAFLAVNYVYNSFVVAPGIEGNENFAFTIYGQVVGGAGYNEAVQLFGRNNPERAYRAAWRFFQGHPLSFFIGAAKAYRDFFLTGIFSYYSPTGRRWWDVALSIICLGSTVWGIFKSVRKIRVPTYSLVLAGFIGFILSIPFLPPRDGGVRFYASTVPFFFLLPTIAFEGVVSPLEKQGQIDFWLKRSAVILSTLLLGLTVLIPVLAQQTGRSNVDIEVPSCPVDQTPFAVQLDAGSFIDLVPDMALLCGRAPEICLSDFKANSDILDLSDLLVYRELVNQVDRSGKSIRVFPARELLHGVSGLFTAESAKLQKIANNSIISGCASRVVIAKRPDIYRIETLFRP